MIRCFARYTASFSVIAFISAASFLFGFVLSTANLASATPDPGSTACTLLTPADIAKATGLKVDNGTVGPPVPGVLGKCTWTAGSGNRVIVTLSDAQHMQITIAATEKSGGTDVPGLGSKAVGIKAAAFTGGGYIVSVIDTKGGFGVSTLGNEGSRDHAIALAKIVASRR
jgi:hypothetical protein